jgi:hypothetical protein
MESQQAPKPTSNMAYTIFIIFIVLITITGIVVAVVLLTGSNTNTKCEANADCIAKGGDTCTSKKCTCGSGKLCAKGKFCLAGTCTACPAKGNPCPPACKSCVPDVSCAVKADCDAKGGNTCTDSKCKCGSSDVCPSGNYCSASSVCTACPTSDIACSPACKDCKVTCANDTDCPAQMGNVCGTGNPKVCLCGSGSVCTAGNYCSGTGAAGTCTACPITGNPCPTACKSCVPAVSCKLDSECAANGGDTCTNNICKCGNAALCTGSTPTCTNKVCVATV